MKGDWFSCFVLPFNCRSTHIEVALNVYSQTRQEAFVCQLE